MADTRYLGPPIPAPGPGRTRRPRHVGAHGPDQVRPPRTPGPTPAHMSAPNANAVAHASEHARFNRPPTPINPTPAHGIEHDAHTEMAGMASAAHGQSMRPGRMAPDPAAVMSPVAKNHARLGIFKGEGGY